MLAEGTEVKISDFGAGLLRKASCSDRGHGFALLHVAEQIAGKELDFHSTVLAGRVAL